MSENEPGHDQLSQRELYEYFESTGILTKEQIMQAFEIAFRVRAMKDRLQRIGEASRRDPKGGELLTENLRSDLEELNRNK